jgi:hypothetical protein
MWGAGLVLRDGAARARRHRGATMPAVIAVRRWGLLSPHTQQRLLEILPGAVAWLILLTPVAVAFAIRLNDPTKLWILGVGAIGLDLYWFGRTTWTVRSVRRSLRTLQATEKVDWW